MRLILPVIIILSAAFAAIAQQPTGRIEGLVTHGADEVIHDASVQISSLKLSVLTDESGKFVFENIAPGRYTVRVHMEGFSDETRIIDVVAGQTLTANFDLEVGGLKAEVTVTAGGTEQAVSEAFQTVATLGSGEVTSRSTASLGEILEGESGVAKRSFGVGSSRPVIRGFDGDRVLVLQDGLRSGSVGSQSGDHGETADPLAAERIEVVKGPGTLLYGSNALGGVVNVINSDEKEAHDGARGFLTTGAGSANREGALAGGLEYGFRKFVFRGNLTAQRSGDYWTPAGKIYNSSSRNNAGTVGLGYYGDKAYGSGQFSSSIRRYGIPFATMFESAPTFADFLASRGASGAAGDQIDIRQRNYGYRFSGGFRNFKNPAVSEIQYSLDYADYRHKELEVADGAESVGSVFDNKTLSYRAMFEQRNFKKLTGRFGFEGYDRSYEIDGAEQLVTGKIDHKSVSVFGLEEVKLEKVKFQFGGRFESNRYNPVNPIYRDRSFSGVSLGAGVNFTLWKGGALIANYTNSYRAPALEELYNHGPHIGNVTFEEGNQSLIHERANGLDFSLRHTADRFRFTTDVYYYRIRNYVYLAYQDADRNGQVDIEDGLPVGGYEQADANYLGAEFAADASFNGYVGGFLSGDFVRADLTTGENLPRIPPARLRAGLEFKWDALSVKPEAVFAGRQDRLARLETPTAGYGLLNVNGTYTIGKSHFAHIFTFAAYNLTDKLYRNHLSFIKDYAPEMGRGIRFGYTVRFF